MKLFIIWSIIVGTHVGSSLESYDGPQQPITTGIESIGF